MMKTRDHILYLLLIGTLLYSNSASTQELSEEELYKISFDSLAEIEFELDYGTPYLKKVLDVHIRKARIFNDTIELFNAYTESAWNSPFKEGLLYCDSALSISKSLIDYKRISGSHYIKGAIYYENSFPELALDELIKSYDFARKALNTEYEVDALNLIAALKREYGEEEEAIILQNLSLNLLYANKDNIKYFDETYLITLDNIARCYAEVKKLDSARYYARQGMILALSTDEQETFKGLSILDAQINYYDNVLVKSRDTLRKYLNLTAGTSKADLLFYLGKLEEKLGNPKKKLIYFKQADSILSSANFPLIDNVKEIYQDLLKDAILKNEEQLEQTYMNRLINYDSLISTTQARIKNVALRKFDIPFQEQRLKQSELEITEKEKTLVVLYVLTSLIFMGLLFYYFRYRRIKRLYEKVMNEDVKPISQIESSINPNKMNIDKVVVQITLEKLDKWEEDKGFLDKSIDQNKLARLLDTNSTYLSRIINAYKNQSFSNYLKDLRVTYAINYVKNNPQIIRSKSMIQLAEQFGFNSIDVFVRAFKAKVGITPALFFKQLNKAQFVN